MLIITGLGRSGTSCLSGYCCTIGYQTGGEWFDSINAGGELPESIRINNSILAAYEKGSWDKESFGNRIKRIRKHVFKDPRFTWNCPAILETWSHHRKDLKFLVSHRDFDSISRSKKHTNASSLTDQEECRTVFLQFIERVVDLNIPFMVLKFPDYLEQFDRVYDALTKFGGLKADKPFARRKWASWIDSRMVKF